MKKLLKAVGIIFIAIIVISVVAGKGSDSDKKSSITSGGSKDKKEQVTITENTVLLDQDGLVITAKSLKEDTIWGTGIEVMIENNTEKNLGVQCNSLIVNNYMISELFSSSVAAGMKANETIYLYSGALEAAGINTISDVVMSFHVYNSDSYDTVFDSAEVELKTSAYGTVEQPAMDEGQELYNQDGIKIVGKYVDEDSFWGAGVLLYMENNSGENVEIQCDNMSINGYMVTPLFSTTVNNGRMALDTITILSTDLETNGIESVQDVELVFRILDADTFMTITETDPIAFSIGK